MYLVLLLCAPSFVVGAVFIGRCITITLGQLGERRGTIYIVCGRNGALFASRQRLSGQQNGLLKKAKDFNGHRLKFSVHCWVIFVSLRFSCS